MPTKYKNPILDNDLAKWIDIVRRDYSNLLFHFTRSHTINAGRNCEQKYPARQVLENILEDKKIKGSSRWSVKKSCVCFTEAPISEFIKIFSLVNIASSKKQRPRYEPYGIAVQKEWFLKKGGRPVIYEKSSNFDNYNDSQKYRLVEYDPEKKIDFTWEREWRIQTDSLPLDNKKTLIIVPTADEAFEIVYNYALKERANILGEGTTASRDVAERWDLLPYWMAVSLDIFGIHFEE